MATNAVISRSDGDLAQRLQEARQQLSSAEGEVVLDFSDVRRIDPSAVSEMKHLADTATEKGLKIVLRGVNVETYRVLKLAQLATRFSFLS